MEKKCTWYFGSEGGIDIGPNDPIHQTFKGNPYYSIVRESIQNSLDVVNDNRFPVNISFQYFNLNRLEYPSFFQLEEHIKQSQEYFKNNPDAKRLFNDMLFYLNGNEKGKKQLLISCLKISDSNTTGMHYVEGNTESPFYAFLRAAGVSSKINSGSGGSFGFGKGAYFALSPIKTLVVSSKDTEGNVYFEGATRLTTHKNDSGKKLTAYGFYDSSNGEPVSHDENIPEVFRRKETGTDINIIGLWDIVNRDRLMIKSVLNNFWLSIHEHKLVVKINDITISKENLEQVIDEYFPSQFESGNATEIESWNPKPYYKAVKYADVNDHFKFFTDELPTLGKVKLYVYLEKGLPNRTSFFRSPKMVVFKRTNKKINGYAAVFICDNQKGNETLRMMENPAHNVWSKDNYPKEEGKITSIARKAENELNDYVNSKLESLSKINTSKKVAFLGLEDYLSIPQDLLEQDDYSDFSGENTNPNSGMQTKDLSQDETGMQTTSNDGPVKIKPSIKTQSEIKGEQDAESVEDGDIKITLGGENENDGGDEAGSGDGDKDNTGKKSEEVEKGSKILVNVKLKVAGQREQDIFYHNLIISSDVAISNAELELLVSGDNDKDDGIAIISTDIGKIEGNKLKEFSLEVGRNKIKVRFADNLKHSLKIKAYEVQ
jgi:hypothetical protein